MSTKLTPRSSFHGPDAVRVALWELGCQLAQYRVIVCRFVMTHAFPVERFRRRFGVWITIEHGSVSRFCVRPVFVHERNARQSQFQLRSKLVLRQVPFVAIPFDAVCIEYDDSGCPDCVEAMEVDRVFFDVYFERDERVVDE